MNAKGGLFKNTAERLADMTGTEQVEAGVAVDPFHVPLHNPTTGGKFTPLLQRYVRDGAPQPFQTLAGITMGKIFRDTSADGAKKVPSGRTIILAPCLRGVEPLLLVTVTSRAS